MNILRTYVHGIGEASRRPVTVGLLWLANIILAAPAGLLFAGALGAAVGRSASPLDQDAVIEFLAGSSAAIRGSLTACLFAAVLGAFVSVFTFGGILQTLVRGGAGERPGQAFFAGGARYYGRFLRLTLYSAVLWVPALVLFAVVHAAASTALRGSTNERLGFALMILRVLWALFLAFLVKMIMDYARIRIVREDTNRVYDALVWAVRFVGGRPGMTLVLYYLLGITGWAMLAAYLALDRLLPGSGTAIGAFLLAQVFIAGRGWLKIAYQAAQIGLYDPTTTSRPRP